MSSRFGTRGGCQVKDSVRMEFGEESCFEDLVFGGWCLRVGCAPDALPFLMIRSKTSGEIMDIRDKGMLTDDCHPSTAPECRASIYTGMPSIYEMRAASPTLIWVRRRRRSLKQSNSLAGRPRRQALRGGTSVNGCICLFMDAWCGVAGLCCLAHHSGALLPRPS